MLTCEDKSCLHVLIDEGFWLLGSQDPRIFLHTFIDPSCHAFPCPLQYHNINNQSLVLKLGVFTVPSNIGVVIIVP